MTTNQLDGFESELSALGAEFASVQNKLTRLDSGESYLDLQVGRTVRGLAAHDPFAASLLTRFETTNLN